MTVRLAFLVVLFASISACTAPGPPTGSAPERSQPPIPTTVTISPHGPGVQPSPAEIPTPSATAGSTRSIVVGLDPCAMTQLDGSVWVTAYGGAKVVEIDGATSSIGRSVSVGRNPCGVAAANGHLWVAVLGENAIVEVDPASGSVVAKIDAAGQPWDVQYGFGSIWSPVQGTNEVLRIDPANGSIIARVESGPMVSGLAITQTEVWVANQGGTTIDRIDPRSNTVTGHISLTAAPFWFAVGGGSVLVAHTADNSAVLIDAASGKPGAAIAVGTRPHDPGFVDGRFWVPNGMSANVSVIDPVSGAVVDTIDLPGSHNVFVADEALGDGWVLDYGSSTVYRIGLGSN